MTTAWVELTDAAYEKVEGFRRQAPEPERQAMWLEVTGTSGNRRVDPSGPLSKGLILAQNERWRRGLGMQVGRAARPVAQG